MTGQSRLRLEATPRPANPNAIIKSRIPPDPQLRSLATSLYTEQNLSYFESPDEILSDQQKHWMALDGHSRYYAPNYLYCDCFRRLKPGNRVYRYLFGNRTVHWPASWPATHTSDILPTFLHRSLSEADFNAALTFVDQIITFVNGIEEELLLNLFDGEECCNILDLDGKWNVTRKLEEVAALSVERLKLWQAAIQKSLELRSEGWPGRDR